MVDAPRFHATYVYLTGHCVNHGGQQPIFSMLRLWKAKVIIPSICSYSMLNFMCGPLSTGPRALGPLDPQSQALGPRPGHMWSPFHSNSGPKGAQGAHVEPVPFKYGPKALQWTRVVPVPFQGARVALLFPMWLHESRGGSMCPMGP